jgi:hypothetical protein
MARAVESSSKAIMEMRFTPAPNTTILGFLDMMRARFEEEAGARNGVLITDRIRVSGCDVSYVKLPLQVCEGEGRTAHFEIKFMTQSCATLA